jgi:hypothetical protein
MVVRHCLQTPDTRRRMTNGIDVQSRKRVLVLVNPVGGKGKARSIVKETVLPIFEAAGCAVTMMGKYFIPRCGSLADG